MIDRPAVSGSAAPTADSAAEDVVVRPLSSDGDFRACVELQKLTWGENFSECVPPTILKVSQRIGGVAAGAFDEGGGLLGFVFGMTGLAGGEAVHWSDMLAVRPEARNLGLGQRLKRFQADAVRELGVKRILWTFDPLVARNAHLNLNKLGARVVEYQPDMYGTTESALHRIGTDRFVVSWRFDGNGADRDAAPSAGAADAPVLNGDAPGSGAGELYAPVLRVEIPVDIDAVQRVSMEEAARWRRTTRAAFLAALERGYEVIGFERGSAAGPFYYVLRRRAGGAAKGE